MTAEDRLAHVVDLFERALRRPEDERRAFVEIEAAGDGDLAARVFELLATDAASALGSLHFAEDPDVPDDLRSRIARRFGADVLPDVALDDDATAPTHDSSVLEVLKARGPSSSRYRLKGEVGKGGMGIVFRVYDQDLRRQLAMKVLLTDDDPGRLARFLEEAQVTGQLDHPGIVPVHELGLDKNGRVFFTMKLVKGRTFRDVLDAVHAGDADWNPTRALSTLLRVCEAMAFAHEKGVVHRDLKPANVMVGRHGETYVMDWGLSKVLGLDDHKDVRIRQDDETLRHIHSERRDRAGSDSPSDSPLVTMDGDVVGTPAYMPVEQAEGRVDKVGPQADVYAVGAMLYHLLTGRAPYSEEGAVLSGRQILRRVIAGPPATPDSISPQPIPAELLAICEKAMERDLDRRYSAMADLAHDLRAFLEQRVVTAYRTGAIAELKKWVQRNKPLAAAAAALVLVLAIATFVVSRQKAEVATKNFALGKANVEISNQRNAVSARKAEFDQLAGVVLLGAATANQEPLYPAWPEKIADFERWIAGDAKQLLDLKPTIAKTISDLEARALPWTDTEREADRQSHPQSRALTVKSAELEWRRRREDATRPIPEPPPEFAAMTATELVEFAWARASSDFSRRVAGEERLALVAARTAVAKVEAGDASTHLEDALDASAWIAFANGHDDEARAASDRSIEVSSGDDRPRYESSRRELDGSIGHCTGAEGARTLDELEREVAQLETEVDRRRTYRFDDPSQSFLQSTLTKLTGDVEDFESGAVATIQRRLAWARTIAELTRDHPKARVTWEAARRAIAKADGVVASSLYRASPMDLEPQLGLVPIGANPVTKFWEFYHLRSACDVVAGQDPASIEIPEHAEDGSIEVTDGTGIVFVLVPGGVFLQGAQNDDESAPNFDPLSKPSERPQRVTLAPFLVARHEMTKGQWYRLSDGEEPSFFRRGQVLEYIPPPVGWTHPVEQVDWLACDRLLREHELRLPTEAQWEYSARGETTTPWSTGSNAASLSGAANVLDLVAEAHYPSWGRQEGDFDDGSVGPVRVGSYRPNPFGLFDVHGNLWEWCADPFMAPYGPPRPEDGLRTRNANDKSPRVSRGGSASHPASSARSANRWGEPIDTRYGFLGVRPARALLRDVAGER